MRIILLTVFALTFLLVRAEDPVFIWVEGENTSPGTQVVRHPWWYDQVEKRELSGNDFISHWSNEHPGIATYLFQADEPGSYRLWLRANPTQSRLRISLNNGAEREVDTSTSREQINIAKDDKPDLRFIGWIDAGEVTLRPGPNRLSIRFTSDNNHHGMLDAFTLVKGPFTPFGTAKPNEAARRMETADGRNWKPWNPGRDPHRDSPIDLRRLNEQEAGAQGWVTVQDGQFTLGSGQSVRFWAVNGPHKNLRGEDLQHALRDLAKRGVNLVRIHGAIFDKNTGRLREDDVARIREVVRRAKAEGIYTHLSIYFPLWFDPQAGLEFLEGYDGASKPFASLFFNPAFESHYQEWWRLLLTSSEGGGETLLREPALFGVELVNEDSFFFWTFTDNNLPEPQLVLLESLFHDWVVDRYGSVEEAYTAWNGQRMRKDTPDGGRLDFRSLYNMFSDRTPRDQDTARFLAETQRDFYQRQVAFLKGLGFKGLITASNWHTANDRIFKPLELWSYLPGDFIDRHGYFGTFKKGTNVSWSIRAGHTYADRSAFRFESREPGGPRDFSHPVADVKVNGMPSMISETTWTRPNRYRTEAPLFYAAYASLQDSDSIVHFAHDGAGWNVKPQYWMQPWTLMSPSQMGQFPATALIYRRGDIAPGERMATVGLSLREIFSLQGTPLVQEGNLDELRLVDVTQTGPVKEGNVIDPRIHFIGRTELRFGENPPETVVASLAPYLDEDRQLLKASNNQIQLDYGKGVLKVRAPLTQALAGNLNAAGPTDLGVLSVDSPLDLGHIILVSLDGAPLSTSGSMLLQVMTEERNTDWKQRNQIDTGTYLVRNIGRDPWRYKAPEGDVRLTRDDAGELTVTPLDLNGYPREAMGNADNMSLRDDTVYYWIHR